MSVSVLGLFLVIANVCGAGMIVPQVVRLRRSDDMAGVSVGWTGVGLGLNGWWAIYGVARELWGLLPVSVVALLLYGVMAAQMITIGRRRAVTVGPRLGAGLIVTTALPALALWSGDWSSLGLTLGLAYAVQFLPALIAAVVATTRSGISSGTWAMALIEASVWLVYGLQLDDLALVVGGAGGAITAGAILMLLYRGGGRAERLTVRPMAAAT